MLKDRTRYGTHGFVVALMLCAVARGQEVQRELWGFDGQVVAQRFNLLSVYFFNDSAQPWDGELRLEQGNLVGGTLGAPLRERCFLAPHTGRWVQFCPFVSQDVGRWELSWGRQTQQLTEPALGGRARVLLEAEGEITRAVEGVRTFPAARFPVTVAATDALAAVALDHAPDWDEARVQAFLDWLHGGGIVHVLQRQGTYPHFAGKLEVLNAPVERQRVGAGIVYHHDFGRSALDQDKAARLGLASESPPESHWPQPVDQLIRERLQSLVTPHHAWGAIGVLAGMFVLMIGPLPWWLSRTRLDYRGTLLLMLAVVALFSFAFYELGKRGQGENASVTSLAYARDLGGGAWDMTEFVSVFVTSGDYYKLAHGSEHNLYSAGSAYEAVSGYCVNGKEGFFLMEIPVFTSGFLLHRAKVQAPELPIRIAKWPERGRLDSLVLDVGDDLPDSAREIIAIHGREVGHFVGTSVSATRLSTSSEDVPAKLAWRYHTSVQTPLEDACRDVAAHVIAEHMVAEGRTPEAGFTADDELLLFVLMPSPKELRLVGQDLGVQNGFVVYQLTFTKD